MGATARTTPIVPPFLLISPTIPPSRRLKTTICV